MVRAQETLTILYLGRKGPAHQRLTTLLQRAGYAVTVEPRPVDDLRKLNGGGRAFVFTARPDRRGSRGAKRGAGPARRRAEKLVAMNLRSLRESTGKTQGEVARKTAMSQPQLSRMEARRDHLMSTLRRYVQALGGDIEVVAHLDGERVALQDI
jgi:hypothetical protein